MQEVRHALLELLRQVGAVEPDYADSCRTVAGDRLHTGETSPPEHSFQVLQSRDHGQGTGLHVLGCVVVGSRKLAQRATVLVAEREVRQQIRDPPAAGCGQAAPQHRPDAARSGDRIARVHRPRRSYRSTASVALRMSRDTLAPSGRVWFGAW